ncbi:expressed unknown protein [Seminavis robusta]|uniref:Uncharacterized protein n=1 Tax=Seminavis robusta TaxID=568900 RepID=A0A9N8DM72_9STRA|nr:expressed unknown protein [Seminavis robusta]|eukprot:Sro132_g062790.1 n/a (270) ;mRNA; f:101609-102418
MRVCILINSCYLLGIAPLSWGFVVVPDAAYPIKTSLKASPREPLDTEVVGRRALLQNAAGTALISATSLLFGLPSVASAASFTAGGTLVDREVGVQVGNPEASASRKPDNSNVIFDKDHYFKFGVAAPWIENGSTEFPKSMPFTPSQQRYDALKKYGNRVRSGAEFIGSLDTASIPDPATAPEYSLRAMGLLANSFLASENTGATNELFLARWYINEIFLLLNDARAAASPEEATAFYKSAKKATNSYLGLLNRVINAKVGDPFAMLSV